jgi:hypothetical protein
MCRLLCMRHWLTLLCMRHWLTLVARNPVTTRGFMGVVRIR